MSKIINSDNINFAINDFSNSSEFLNIVNIEELFLSLRKSYAKLDALNEDINTCSIIYLDNPSIHLENNIFKNSYLNVIWLHEKLYSIMLRVQEIFKSHLANKPIFENSTALKSWLHIDATFKKIKAKKSHQFFSQFGELKEGDIKWRIGTYNELRTYTNNILGTKNELFLSGFKNESQVNQRIILEIEAIFTYIQSLRQKVRLLNSNISHNYDLFITIESLKKNITLLG